MATVLISECAGRVTCDGAGFAVVLKKDGLQRGLEVVILVITGLTETPDGPGLAAVMA